jgi:two-component system sensor histidine kinase BaeS
MQRMLEDLISMSKLDKADTSDFKYGWVNVNEPVKQAIKDHQNLANRKKQNLAEHLAENLPNVLLDVDQFKLAIKHLILNGLSYSPEGGTVTVETLANQSNVVVEVRDTGRGIDASDLPHIFEHFYRADPARGGQDGGTGVGLTIAKKIIEAHGGTIQAESQPGQGSKFSIFLPIQPH